MKTIPMLTLRRLPQYLEILFSLQKEGKVYVSATQLAEITGVHMTQVRKDLACTGVQGQPKVGHKLQDLIPAIEDFLNWNDVTDCFLAGAGHLGSALLGYQGFSQKGIKIVAAFDTDPTLVGGEQHGVQVYHIEKLANLAKRLHILIGIITTPPEEAQKVANIMVEGGILALWNFTPVTLQVPSTVIVENVDLFSSLAVLSRRLNELINNN